MSRHVSLVMGLPATRMIPETAQLFPTLLLRGLTPVLPPFCCAGFCKEAFGKHVDIPDFRDTFGSWSKLVFSIVWRSGGGQELDASDPKLHMFGDTGNFTKARTFEMSGVSRCMNIAQVLQDPRRASGVLVLHWRCTGNSYKHRLRTGG